MAAAHKVKCAICGEIFDLNKIQGVRHGARRYAHQECYPEGELVPLPEETPEYKNLKSLDFIWMPSEEIWDDIYYKFFYNQKKEITYDLLASEILHKVENKKK